MSGAPGSASGGLAFLPAVSVRRFYTQQEVLTESPAQLVLTVLDFVLDALRKKHGKRVNRGIRALIESLDYRYETAWAIQELYDTSLALVKQGNFSEAYTVLHEFRDTWEQAFHLDLLQSPAVFLKSVRRDGYEVDI